MHTLVTAALWYLFVGAVIWMVLDGLGIPKASVVARRAAGRAVTTRGVVMATLLVIVAWPRFVWVWARGMRRASR
jgi:hypothetical protein